MSFADPWVLHFLWLAPLLGFVLVVKSRLSQRALARYADPELRARLAPPLNRARRVMKGILLISALALLILALAGPRWGSRIQEVSQKGVDIMLLVDVSRSMMVEDIKPSRLKRAEREIVDFMKVVRGDRVGLVAFAGAAFVQCPLTLDYAALEMFTKALSPGLIPVPGTDIGAALETGLEAFDFKAQTDKVMLLITDGEDNEKRALPAAQKAAGKGVKIFVFGMGDPGGGPIPAEAGQGGFQKDKGGKLLLSKLDESGLKALAQASGGTYVRSMAGDLDLDLLYFDGIKRATRDQTLKSGKIRIFEERFYIFILAALVLLLLEGSIVQRPAAGRKAGLIALLAAVGLSLLAPAGAGAAELSPDELYRAGRYQEAEKGYNHLDMENPRDLSYRFNRGCAAFQAGKAKEAMAAFSSVLRRAQEPGLRFKAAYNLGMTAFKQGDYASALEYFRQALKHDPANPKAGHNLELALRALQKQKEQQNQQKNQKQQNQNSQKSKAGDQQKQDQKQKNKSQEPPKDGKDQNKSDQNQGQKDQHKQKEPQQAKSQADKQPDKQKGSGEQKSEPQKQPQNLDGELKSRDQSARQESRPQAKPQAKSNYEKQKAEALLDNIKEDPARMMRFAQPDQTGTASGKDW